ncbi:MAG: hypothetical protein JSU01_04010 [Bacteroidetes bacterium]|nr:hypothetical protein [Bacteroidota bacterium]
MDSITTNQLWASNLLRLSAVLIAVAYFVSPMDTHFEFVMVGAIISMVITIALAYFVRKGYEAAKWILLALLTINLTFSVLGARELLKFGRVYAVISQSINLVQIVALILLFLPAKKNTPTDLSEDAD